MKDYALNRGGLTDAAATEMKLKAAEDSAKRLTRGKNGMGYEQRKTALRNYLQGWVEYFDYADMGNKVKDIDQWLRRRLRKCIWKTWKKPRTRVKNLIRCGIDRWRAYQWGNTS